MSDFAELLPPVCEQPAADAVQAALPTTGLGPEIDDLVAKSPTLQAKVAALTELGWGFMYGDLAPLQGSYTDAPNQTIVLDPSRREDPLTALQSLSHEAGHATYERDPAVAMDGLTREEFIAQSLLGNHKDEGEAILTGIEVRQEILDATGTLFDPPVDIGISGGADAEYLALYENAPLDDRDQLRADLGAIQAQREITSTTHQPYDEFYGEQYEEKWDNAHDGWPLW